MRVTQLWILTAVAVALAASVALLPAEPASPAEPSRVHVDRIIARGFYAKTAKAFKEGRKDPYTQSLQFTVARGGTADPDNPVAMASTK